MENALGSDWEARTLNSAGHIGHDLWLTRNGHGAGFWDGDYPDDIEDTLTKGAEALGECYVEVSRRGRLSFTP